MAGANVDSRPRSRRTAFMFFMQTFREEHENSEPKETNYYFELTRACKQRWDTMTDAAKKSFHEMAVKDKNRFEEEMKNYVSPKPEKKSEKECKPVEKSNHPKRTFSAFFWFCQDERDTVKEQNPEFDSGQVATALVKRWVDANSEVKDRYEAIAVRDQDDQE